MFWFNLENQTFSFCQFKKANCKLGHQKILFSKKFVLNVAAILFEEAILLGAENDTMLYTSDSTSPFSLPFCTLERTVSIPPNF